MPLLITLFVVGCVAVIICVIGIFTVYNQKIQLKLVKTEMILSCLMLGIGILIFFTTDFYAIGIVTIAMSIFFSAIFIFLFLPMVKSLK